MFLASQGIAPGKQTKAPVVALQAGLIVFDRFLACDAWMFVVSVSGRAGVRLFFSGYAFG